MKNIRFILLRTTFGVTTLCMCQFNIAFANFALTPNIGDTNHSRAGGAAIAEDATTVFTNAAGLMRLEGQNWSMVTQYYMPSTTFRNRSSTDAFGQALSGGNGGDGGVATFIPSLYYANRITNDWALGISVNTPFGLSTEYEQDWVGRYQTVNTGIKTINVNPSLAYKLNKQWALGVGISYQYIETQLSSAIDFGAVCLNEIDPSTCSALGMPAPQSADGYAELDAKDWSPGFNFGILWSADNTRMGLAYRSKVSHTLKGNANFTIPTQANVFQPAFTDTNVSVPFTLPEMASLSLYHQWLTNFSIMGDVTLTRWSRFDKLEINYENEAQPDQTLVKDWQDTTRVALGFNYQLNTPLTIQWGVAYEKSPIPDNTYEPGIPVSDMTWFNLGAKYNFSHNIALDFGLVHVQFKQRDVNITGQFGETLNGVTNTDLNIVNIQLNGVF